MPRPSQRQSTSADRDRHLARLLGLSDLPCDPPVCLPEGLAASCLPPPGGIALLTGGSGAGKSTLWRAACAASVAPVVDVRRIRLTGRVADALGPQLPPEQVLRRLAAVGLAQASLLPRDVHGLSAGERFRLALARCLRPAQRPILLACDEFASELDEASAVSCSRTLARTVSASGGRLSALLATWREELAPELRPCRHVHCDYGHYEITGTAASAAAPG